MLKESLYDLNISNTNKLFNIFNILITTNNIYIIDNILNTIYFKNNNYMSPELS